MSGELGPPRARGPGFANSINPLAAAIHYHLPLLLIVGESPPSTDRSWQVLEQRALTAALGAGFHHAATGDDLVARFWEAYFALARADFAPSRYSHVLLHWPPSKSCRSR